MFIFASLRSISVAGSVLSFGLLVFEGSVRGVSRGHGLRCLRDRPPGPKELGMMCVLNYVSPHLHG